MGISPPSAAVAQKLKDLHPQFSLPLSKGLALPVFESQAKEVKSAIRTFPIVTAPGPSRISIASRPPSGMFGSPVRAERFATFVNMTLNGSLPDEFASLCTSVAIQEKR